MEQQDNCPAQWLYNQDKKSEIGKDNVFFLLRKDKDGNIFRVKYIGVWVIVDGGFLNWLVTVVVWFPIETMMVTMAIILNSNSNLTYIFFQLLNSFL